MSTTAAPTPKKVAIVFQFFPHYRSAVLEQLGRSERYEVLFLADEKDVIYTGIPPWQRPEHLAFQRTNTRKLLGHVMWQSGLLRLSLRRHIQTIIYIANPYWPATWLSALLARLCGKRVLFWTHGWIMPETGPKDWIRRMFLRIAHALLLYGNFAKQCALQRGFRPERLHVVYNALDFDKQSSFRTQVTDADRRQSRAELFAKPQWPVLICMTRLGRLRRLDLLLSAMHRLAEQGHPVNLLLVGDGPERQALEEMARRWALSVHFYGACYDESRLARLITAANVTVAPGVVGLAAMHSLAYGVPVISHDDWTRQTPEFEAIIPGQNGDLFRREDVDDLVAAIRRWTTTELVPEQVRQACVSIIERFWNPTYQRRVIERAIEGTPADDLFWLASEGDSATR